MKSRSLFHRSFIVLVGLIMLSCNLLNRAGQTAEPGAAEPEAESQAQEQGVEPGSSNPQGTGGEAGFVTYPTATPAPQEPTWQPQLETILSQPLSAEAQKVEVPGSLAIDIPAGMFTDAPPTLVVSQVKDEVPELLPGWEVLQAYEISLGDLHELAAPLSVTLPYDASRLDPSLSVEEQLSAVLREGATGHWVNLPATFDENAHTVSFETDHLSMVVLYLKTQYDTTCESPHFKIRYNATDIQNHNLEMSFTPGLNACATPGHPDFINAIVDYLESAYAGYTAEGFKFPDAKIFVYPAYLVGSKFGDDPQFDWLTGAIVIAARYTDAEDQDLLRHDCAHELFHYWQFMNAGSLGTYLRNQWWMDATADYAADKAAWTGTPYGRTNGMGTDIRGDYLQFGLEETSDYHAYSTAHFVDYLMTQSYAYATFFDLYDANDNTGHALVDLQTSLSERIGEEFGEVYKEFAEYMLFDPSSKLPLKDTVWDTKAVSFASQYHVGDGEFPLSATVVTFGSVLWGIRVDKATFMSLEWTNPNDGMVFVFFKSGDDTRDGTRADDRLFASQKAIFPMYPDDTAYVLMIDPTFSDLDFNLVLNASEVEYHRFDLGFDSSDATCADYSGYGSPNYFLEIDEDTANIHYDSSTDDYYWTEMAEHTTVAAGTGTVTKGVLKASMEAVDKVRMGSSDAKGQPVYGNVTIRANLTLTANPNLPLAIEGTAEGTATVNLPANGEFKGYTCVGTVNQVWVYPAYYFPGPKK